MSEAADIERGWSVLLLGGPSGAGKTSASYPLAMHFGVGITEIDDLHIAVKHLTTPVQQPVLHAWDTQIVRNFALREPDAGDQLKRARVSWLFGQWLRDECRRPGLIAMPPRPWDTLLQRIVEATR